MNIIYSPIFPRICRKPRVHNHVYTEHVYCEHVDGL